MKLLGPSFGIFYRFVPHKLENLSIRFMCTPALKDLCTCLQTLSAMMIRISENISEEILSVFPFERHSNMCISYKNR